MEEEKPNSCTPQVLEHLVGMPHLIERVRIGLNSAWRDGAAFPHAALVGPPGLGKSLLADVIAKEMGVELKQTLAQNLSHISDLHAFLLDANDRDVLFLDECDELKPQAQTVLYRSLEDGLLFMPKTAKQNPVTSLPLNRFTMLLASNHESCLVEPLRDRCKLILRFTYYSDEEICLLLQRRVQALGWTVDDDVLPLIAARSRGTPRLAIKLLDATWRCYRATSSDPVITKAHLAETLRLEGLDSLGLDATEAQCLTILAESRAPVRLSVLAMRLGNIPTRTVATVVESYLLRTGLITRTDTGREITEKGRAHLKSLQAGS